jgi:acrylyl-CoA reductase (NADPH)
MMNTSRQNTSIPPSFKAWRITHNQRVEAAVADVSLDDLTPGDVVVRTAYAGLNYKDALATTNHGKVIRHFPRIGGSDLAGVVISSADPRFAPGDAVMAYAGGLGVDEDGGFSEYVRLRASRVRSVPANLSLLEAAALGVAGTTAALAIHLLEENGLRPGTGNVLISGATGGVGTIGIEMLSALGYDVTAMTSKPHHDDLLRQLGAAEVIRTTAVTDGSRPLERPVWSGAIDNVGADVLPWMIRTVRERGTIASIGNAGGNTLKTSVLPFILRGVRLIGVNLSAYTDMEDRLLERLSTDLRPRLLTRSAHVISLDELPENIDRMLTGQTVGRIVVGLWEQPPA